MTMAYFSQTHSPFRRGSIMDEEQELEKYFENYVPLSNLPTPPLSAAASPTEDYIHITPQILAPAIHLSKLIPASASRTRLSPATLADYIARSNRSLQTLGFAACLLDSLSSSFIRNWRAAIIECTSPSNNTSSKRSSTHRPSRSSWSSASYNWKPELIVLAALQVSSSFLDDVRSSPRWWAESIARGNVLATELDATIRCLLQDIGYDLCSFQGEDVQHMMRAMQRGIDYYESIREEESSPISDGSPVVF